MVDCDFETWIADYLLENGVIVPPCKVGDSIFLIMEQNRQKEIEEGIVEQINVFKNNMSIRGYLLVDGSFRYPKFLTHSYLFGKTVFLTREEAERALKGGEG